MTYQTLSDYNTSEGLHILFIYASNTVPVFIPMLLFSVFSIILLATYFSQKTSTGKGHFPSSFAVAGFITLIIAFVMRLIPNLINNTTLIVTLIVAVIGVMWVFISRN